MSCFFAMQKRRATPTTKVKLNCVRDGHVGKAKGWCVVCDPLGLVPSRSAWCDCICSRKIRQQLLVQFSNVAFTLLYIFSYYTNIHERGRARQPPATPSYTRRFSFVSASGFLLSPTERPEVSQRQIQQSLPKICIV